MPFVRPGTSSYEAEAELADIVDVLKEVMDLLVERPGGGTLDYLWIHVDEPE